MFSFHSNYAYVVTKIPVLPIVYYLGDHDLEQTYWNTVVEIVSHA